MEYKGCLLAKFMQGVRSVKGSLRLASKGSALLVGFSLLLCVLDIPGVALLLITNVVAVPPSVRKGAAETASNENIASNILLESAGNTGSSCVSNHPF